MPYQPGDRVRTTVDAPSAWEGDWEAPSGTLGTVTAHHPANAGFSESYGVLLDGDPTQLPASYYPYELTSA